MRLEAMGSKANPYLKTAHKAKALPYESDSTSLVQTFSPIPEISPNRTCADGAFSQSLSQSSLDWENAKIGARRVALTGARICGTSRLRSEGAQASRNSSGVWYPRLLCGRSELYNRQTQTDPARVVYPWHPFYGHEITIHGERNRRGTIVFSCSLVTDQTAIPVEIPGWMFDTSACCAFRSAPAGRVTVAALRSLRRTLSVTSNEIEVQDSSISLGGSNAEVSKDGKDADRAVSNESPAPAASSRDRSESGCSPGQNASPARRSEDPHGQPSGGRS